MPRLYRIALAVLAGAVILGAGANCVAYVVMGETPMVERAGTVLFVLSGVLMWATIFDRGEL